MSLEKFNTTFKEFITDLVQAFPDDMEFKLYHMGLTTILKNSPSMVLNVFQKEVVEPFETYIMEKNDEFFLNHEYEYLKESTGADVSAIINKIKNYYKSMPSTDKEIVMKYMRVLTRLCKQHIQELDG